MLATPVRCNAPSRHRRTPQQVHQLLSRRPRRRMIHTGSASTSRPQFLFQFMNLENSQLSTLNSQPPLVQPFKFSSQPYEYKVVPLRECPTPEAMQLCDTPDKAAEYWRLHLPNNPYFNPEAE